MKFTTALVAIGTSAIIGVLFALLMTIAPAVIYIYTGVSVSE